MIRLDAISKRYPNGQLAVRELSLDVPDGEICVLVGPSGCGKTTTLKMINRLIEPSSGRIFLDGDDVTHADPVQLRRHIGYVIQQVGLFPHQDIATNVATVPRLLGWPKGRVTARGKDNQGGTRFTAATSFAVTEAQQSGSTILINGETELSGKLAGIVESGAKIVIKKMTADFAERLAARVAGASCAAESGNVQGA